MPFYGCVALGIGTGGVAGIILLVTMVLLARKLKSRSPTFPTKEVGALTSLLIFMTCSVWARSSWFPIRDPLCGANFFLAQSITMAAVCFSTARGVIELCAQIVAEQRRK